MRSSKPQWPQANARDLIAKKVLCIGDGYRAKNSEMGPIGLPFARAGNINGGFLFDGADLLDEANVPRAGEKISRPADIVFTSKGTVGRFAFVNPGTPEFVYSPQLCFWRVLDSSVLDARFLFYWMQSSEFLNQVQQVKGLTDMADYVSLTDQRRMELTLPPLSIQQRIASVLSAYDDLIENNTRRIKILEEMAQMIYREWFVNFRFPGHENVKLVESELGPIPEGWVSEVLRDIMALKSGFAFKSSTFDNRGQFGLVTIRNVHDGIFSPDCQSRIADLPPNLPKFCWLRAGDVLMSLTGNIGRICLVYGRDLLLNQRVAKVIPHRESDTKFAYFFLRQPETRTRLEQISTGVAQQNLSPVKAMEERAVIPSPELRERFNTAVEPIIAEVVNLFTKNANLRATRGLLLPKLISGEIPVEAADDQAAELVEQTA